MVLSRSQELQYEWVLRPLLEEGERIQRIASELHDALELVFDEDVVGVETDTLTRDFTPDWQLQIRQNLVRIDSGPHIAPARMERLYVVSVLHIHPIGGTRLTARDEVQKYSVSPRRITLKEDWTQSNGRSLGPRTLDARESADFLDSMYALLAGFNDTDV